MASELLGWLGSYVYSFSIRFFLLSNCIWFYNFRHNKLIYAPKIWKLYKYQKYVSAKNILNSFSICIILFRLFLFFQSILRILISLLLCLPKARRIRNIAFVPIFNDLLIKLCLVRNLHFRSIWNHWVIQWSPRGLQYCML